MKLIYFITIMSIKRIKARNMNNILLTTVKNSGHYYFFISAARAYLMKKTKIMIFNYLKKIMYIQFFYTKKYFHFYLF